jgi:hypothetical protein
MKSIVGALVAALFATALHAQPATQIHLTTDALSLGAPSQSVLRASGAGTWQLRAHSFTIGIARGPSVADLDDAEPRRCYDVAPIVLDNRRALLRQSRASARLDCPENYVSVYLPPAAPGESALFVWGRSADVNDMTAMAGVIASIRFNSVAAQ